MLLTLNLYSVLCLLYLNESGEKKNWSAEETEAVQEVVGT